MEKNILILGDGLLGSELQKQTEWDIISRKKDGFSITNSRNWEFFLIDSFDRMAATPKYKTIINCIANTDVYSLDKIRHWKVNYKGVADLTDFCNKWDIKLVHISTDYVYTNSQNLATEEDIPIHGNNWYSYTKLLADAYIELKSNNYLICRGTHKPKPFPYNVAWVDQIGNFDYVDVISKLIIEVINKDVRGIYNIGTSLKTIYDLAMETNKNVVSTFKHSIVPSNTTLNLDKLNHLLKKCIK